MVPEKRRILEDTLSKLQREHGILPSDVLTFLSKEQDAFPSSILACQGLSGLEAIVRYLIDIKGLSQRDAAVRLNRDPRTIWTTYQASKRKHPGELTWSDAPFIPISVVATRSGSVLESVCLFLTEKCGLSQSGVADLIGKDPRTVWTVLHRAKEKGVSL